jgi:hypothetical protein
MSSLYLALAEQPACFIFTIRMREIMFIILIAWLYVLGIFCLFLESWLLGGFLFMFFGILPLWLYIWQLIRRRKIHH